MSQSVRRNVLAMREAIIDFGNYPDDALNEVAQQQAFSGDRIAVIASLRNRLLNLDGPALMVLLQLLHDAAQKHGAPDVVEILQVGKA